MGSESIVHEAEGRMGYWFRGHELVKDIETKQLYLVIRDSAAIVLVFKSGAFRYKLNQSERGIISNRPLVRFYNTNKWESLICRYPLELYGRDRSFVFRLDDSFGMHH